MPKTIYEIQVDIPKNSPDYQEAYDIAYSEKYTGNFLRNEMLIMDDWVQDRGKRTNTFANAKQSFLDYIGMYLSDQQFADMENAINNDPQTEAFVFDVLTHMTATEITRDRDTYVKAFAGTAAGYSQEEVNQAKEKIKGDLENGIQAKRIQNGFNDRIKDKIAREKEAMKQARFILSDGMYDENSQLPDPSKVIKLKPGSPELTNEQVKAAGRIIFYSTMPMPEFNQINYDYNDFIAIMKERDKAADNYMDSNADFRSFIMQEMAKGQKNKELFDAENLTKNWERYQRDLKETRDAYKNDKEAFLENPDAEVSEGFKFFDYGKKNENIIDIDEMQYKSVEEMQDYCKKMKEGASKVTEGLSQKDFVAAANCVIADTLLTKASEQTFFSDEKLKYNGSMDVAKVNKAIVEMREQLINDPLFKNVLSRRPSRSDIASLYKAERNKAVNKKITEQKSIDNEYKNNFSKKSAHEKFMKDNSIKLEQDELDFIQETCKNMKKFNEGKDPSKHMKRLMDALDAVTAENKKEIPIHKIDELNKATLNYYKERQGMIFSPITANGKSRLGAVEKLAFKTDKIMERVNVLENKVTKSAVAMPKGK